MDLNEIRQLIETEGGKFIIVENNNPVLVVSSFEDYKNRLKSNKKIENTKPIPRELQEEALKLEDLPLT